MREEPTLAVVWVITQSMSAAMCQDKTLAMSSCCTRARWPICSEEVKTDLFKMDITNDAT